MIIKKKICDECMGKISKIDLYVIVKRQQNFRSKHELFGTLSECKVVKGNV